MRCNRSTHVASVPKGPVVRAAQSFSKVMWYTESAASGPWSKARDVRHSSVSSGGGTGVGTRNQNMSGSQQWEYSVLGRQKPRERTVMRTRNQRKPGVSPKGWHKVSGHPISGRRRTGIGMLGQVVRPACKCRWNLELASASQWSTKDPKSPQGQSQKSVGPWSKAMVAPAW